MRMRIVSVIATSVLLASPLVAQDIAATWQGTFNLDSDARRMVVQIAKNSRGGWKLRRFMSNSCMMTCISTPWF